LAEGLEKASTKFLREHQKEHLLDFPEDTGILSNAHAEELLASPVFIQHVIRVLSKLLHVGSDEHLAKLNEVTVFLIVDFNDTPRIGTPTDLTSVSGIHDMVGTDNSKRNLASDFLSLSQGFFIFVLIARCLEDVNIVVSDVCKDLRASSVNEECVVDRQLTLALKSAISSSVNVSAFAMTGIRFTRVCKRRMNSISSCFRLKRMRSKYKQKR
jgi:hypothetical protein